MEPILNPENALCRMGGFDWAVGEGRTIPSHDPRLSENRVFRVSDRSFIGFNFYQHTPAAGIED